MDPEGPAEDLSIEWAAPFNAIEHPRTGVLGPLPTRRAGGHTPDGFAIIAGPGVAPADLGWRDSRDLPATLLDLLGRTSRAPIEGTSMLSAALSGR